MHCVNDLDRFRVSAHQRLDATAMIGANRRRRRSTSAGPCRAGGADFVGRLEPVKGVTHKFPKGPPGRPADQQPIERQQYLLGSQPRLAGAGQSDQIGGNCRAMADYKRDDTGHQPGIEAGDECLALDQCPDQEQRESGMEQRR